MSSESSPSVLVIGAGVIGASVAWHLTSRGVRDVLLVDAGAGPGAGSTGRASVAYGLAWRSSRRAACAGVPIPSAPRSSSCGAP